jgi:hypothetical protein
MAIVFTKDIATNKLLNTYNNNVVEFYQNNTARTALKCNIIFDGNLIVIYPSPNGYFYYNFTNLVTSIINKKNFADDLEVDIDQSLVYTCDADFILFVDIQFQIILDDLTVVNISRETIWFNSHTQIDNYIETSISNVTLLDFMILTPSKKWNSSKKYVKQWKGYPFDIAVYSINEFTLKNMANDLLYLVNQEGSVKRLIFSNGSSDNDLNNELQISNGIQEIKHSEIETSLLMEYEQNNCEGGHYLKWMNQYGSWSYWLFEKGKKTSSIKTIGSLNNDFYDIEDTTSPEVFMGKESNPNIKIQYSTLSIDENILLYDLFESAKVYLYVGIPGTNSFNDFIEVNIKSGVFPIHDIKRDNLKLDFEIELPKRVTRTL